MPTSLIFCFIPTLVLPCANPFLEWQKDRGFSLLNPSSPSLWAGQAWPAVLSLQQESPPRRRADRGTAGEPSPCLLPTTTLLAWQPASSLQAVLNSDPVMNDPIIGWTVPLRGWNNSILVRKIEKPKKPNHLMEPTGSIFSVAPHTSLTVTCCAVLQTCFPRTNVILIYNAPKDKAGFLTLVNVSVIISSIKNIKPFRLFFHFLLWFGTGKEAQTNVPAPWAASFIFSFITRADPLRNTSTVLKDFWTLDWTLPTGLAAAYNQSTATVNSTVCQAPASCEMTLLPPRIVT